MTSTIRASTVCVMDPQYEGGIKGISYEVDASSFPRGYLDDVEFSETELTISATAVSKAKGKHGGGLISALPGADIKKEKKALNSAKNESAAFFSTDVVFSPLFWSTAVFFTIQVYRAYSYLALVTDSTAEIIQLAGDNLTIEEAQEQAGEMTKHFGYVQFFGVFIAFLNGFLVDKGKQKS